MKYKIALIKQTCGACPSQWEGFTEDSRPFYIRYRYGVLSVYVGEVGGLSAFDALDGGNIYCENHGGELDGVMSESKMMELTSGVLDWEV